MSKTIEELNDIYSPLYEHMKCVLKDLKALGYSYEWGFYNNHSVKQNGEWVLEYYPIPVVTIKDICDIGFDVDSTFIEFKLKREDALCFDFSKLLDYKFEVYGVENYLCDFYNDTLDLEGTADRIKSSVEQEIGISLMLNSYDDTEKIICAVDMLKKIKIRI